MTYVSRPSIAVRRIHPILSGLVGMAVFAGHPAAPSMAGQPRSELIVGHRLIKTFSNRELGGMLGSLATVIFQDRKGIHWVGTTRGLFSYDPKNDIWADHTEEMHCGRQPYVSSVCEDRRGRLWVRCARTQVTDYGSFAVLDGGTWRDAREMLPLGITSMGNILIGGCGGEVSFVTPSRLISYDGERWSVPISPSLEALERYASLDPAYLDPAERARARDLGIKISDPPPWSGDVTSGLQDTSGTIWLAAKRGAWRVNKAKNAWDVQALPEFTLPVCCFAEDRYGRIWLGDRAGHIAVNNNSKGTWRVYDLTTRFGETTLPVAIYVDRQRNVMIAVSAGIVILDEISGGMTPFTLHANGKMMSGLSTMAGDRLGQIWIGSYDGISVLD